MHNKEEREREREREREKGKGYVELTTGVKSHEKKMPKKCIQHFKRLKLHKHSDLNLY